MAMTQQDGRPLVLTMDGLEPLHGLPLAELGGLNGINDNDSNNNDAECSRAGDEDDADARSAALDAVDTAAAVADSPIIDCTGVEEDKDKDDDDALDATIIDLPMVYDEAVYPPVKAVYDVPVVNGVVADVAPVYHG